jgi:predicted N-acetyltransferase YhbS
VRIELLANRRDSIPTLAQWFYDDWAHLRPGWTLQDFEMSIAQRATTNSVPVAVIVFEGLEVIGTVWLECHDMDTRKDLSPWLAGLYVKEEWRDQGIGARLVRAIEAKATELGIHKLYLYTPVSEHFYARLGWSLRERLAYRGSEVAVMEKTLLPEEQK